MNVVIVDDTQINVTLMQALVNRIEGCKPVCFTDSAAGLAWCLENNPDLVIVDYMMPAPDGIEFIQRFRAVPEKSEVPMLMVTADHEKEVRYRALEGGANDFLTKPVRPHRVHLAGEEHARHPQEPSGAHGSRCLAGRGGRQGDCGNP